jgi:HEAT repeat protein
VDKNLATDTKNAVEALINALESGQGIIRWRAAVSLTQIGAPARAALPKLAQNVTYPTCWEIRHAACMALGRVGVDEQNFSTMHALNALMGAIADRESCKEVRIEALQSIINLGPPPAGDIRNFKTALENRLNRDKDKFKDVAIWVRIALMRLDGTYVNESNISAVAKLMKDSDLDIRSQAARALGYIGASAKSAIPELIDALKSDEPLLIVQAAWALSRMGEAADRAIPALDALVNNSKSEDVKATAKAAIEEIKKKK